MIRGLLVVSLVVVVACKSSSTEKSPEQSADKQRSGVVAQGEPRKKLPLESIPMPDPKQYRRTKEAALECWRTFSREQVVECPSVVDAWEGPFRYSAHLDVIVSSGPDRKWDTGDDVRVDKQGRIVPIQPIEMMRKRRLEGLSDRER